MPALDNPLSITCAIACLDKLLFCAMMLMEIFRSDIKLFCLLSALVLWRKNNLNVSIKITSASSLLSDVFKIMPYNDALKVLYISSAVICWLVKVNTSMYCFR